MLFLVDNADHAVAVPFVLMFTVSTENNKPSAEQSTWALAATEPVVEIGQVLLLDGWWMVVQNWQHGAPELATKKRAEYLELARLYLLLHY